MNGRTSPGETLAYSWDTARRMTGILPNGSNQATFTYGGDGNRRTKSSGGLTTASVNDGPGEQRDKIKLDSVLDPAATSRGAKAIRVEHRNCQRQSSTLSLSRWTATRVMSTLAVAPCRLPPPRLPTPRARQPCNSLLIYRLHWHRRPQHAIANVPERRLAGAAGPGGGVAHRCSSFCSNGWSAVRRPSPSNSTTSSGIVRSWIIGSSAQARRAALAANSR